MRFAKVILGALLCLQAHADITADEKSDEALVAAAEQLVAESQAQSQAQTQAQTQVVNLATSSPVNPAELKESEIPVVMSSKKATEEKGSTIWRLVAGLAIIAVTAVAVLYASKRWARQKNQGGQKARIEMMHQFHLGPRKSLALVRVSGETMLIGITDHNINMIKPVTLIDDELEGMMGGKDFNNFLEDEFSIEDVRGALGTRA